MSEKNSNWSKRSRQDWNRNRDRYDRDNDYNRDDFGDAENFSKENYRNRQMQNNFGQAGYGGSSDYRNENRNQNWQADQEGYGNSGSAYPNQNWGNKFSGQYNTGYGNPYNRQENWSHGQGHYTSGMYGSESPGYRRDYKSGDYGANAEYLGGQGGYHPHEKEMNYENINRRDYDRDWWDRTRDEVSSWFGDDEAERRRRTDRQQAGQHKGKGPKGYTRSDQRIQEDVCDRLSDDDRLDATNIEVKVLEGEVVLSGTVNDREQKRRAEDLAERISGVRDVENHIKVKREDSDMYRH